MIDRSPLTVMVGWHLVVVAPKASWWGSSAKRWSVVIDGWTVWLFDLFIAPMAPFKAAALILLWAEKRRGEDVWSLLFKVKAYIWYVGDGRWVRDLDFDLWGREVIPEVLKVYQVLLCRTEWLIIIFEQIIGVHTTVEVTITVQIALFDDIARDWALLVLTWVFDRLILVFAIE